MFPGESRLTEAGASDWIAAPVAVVADTSVFTALAPTATIAGCDKKQYLHQEPTLSSANGLFYI